MTAPTATAYVIDNAYSPQLNAFDRSAKPLTADWVNYFNYATQPNYPGRYWTYPTMFSDQQADFYSGQNTSDNYPFSTTGDPLTISNRFNMPRPTIKTFLIPCAAGARSFSVKCQHYTDDDTPLLLTARSLDTNNPQRVTGQSIPATLIEQTVTLNITLPTAALVLLSVERTQINPFNTVLLGDISTT